ncbi:DALR anticodon-binding domain-containing protein 3 [Ostrinia furnacalis]|uniref:DALR anticodon-binding domain-containing protein 3 n=1 Tax=Ostrinia furnacalis TaxID=93504 RepID=UPI001040DF85|nr:DALR anticodon-binding domain-containing protein 3 [Ostrinia furnacalis]
MMMVENVLDAFTDDVFQFLTKKPKLARNLLVKKHSENLQTQGDFSFPDTLKSWHEHIDLQGLQVDADGALMSCIGKEATDLITESKNWRLEVAKVTNVNGRVHMFLDRLKSIPVGLAEALEYNNELIKRISDSTNKVRLDSDSDDDSLTSLRLKYLTKSIDNLYSIHAKASERTDSVSVIVTSKSTFKSGTGHAVLCGVVLNAKTGAKEVNIKADDFIRIRQEEMSLIAQHKYGVRVSTDTKWKEFIAHLGESAVVFELLQSRPNSAVKINFDCSAAGSSKGAAFILYNCARLEAIIKTFNERVDEGAYPPLPSFKDIDFNLLAHEDEWCLIFNFIMGFPLLLNNCVDISETTCEFKPHLLCNFLCCMVRVFSQYYRKVRILTEPRKHLLPVLFARLHMLKILNETLKTCLDILNIKSVSQMYSHFYFLHRFYEYNKIL